MASGKAPEMPSPEIFRLQLEQLRKAADEKFRAFRANAECSLRTKRTPYIRDPIRGLREALILNACRYAAACAWKNARIRSAKRTWRVSVLGEGAPKTGIWAVRKERCAISRAATHSRKHTSIPFSNSAPRSGDETLSAMHFSSQFSSIPEDICRIRASKFTSSKKLHSAFVTCAIPIVTHPTAPLQDARGYMQHVVRAQTALQNGQRVLRPQRESVACNTRATTAADDAAAVRARYAGRPDELYRRRMGRRFAVERRRRAAEEAERTRFVRSAEREMQRRRGTDLLHTDRELGDSSFAPFVYEQPDCAFAFSTRITEAPKLRKAMLHKYSTAEPQPLAPALDQLQRAHHVAETKELFHTRVMNRFA